MCNVPIGETERGSGVQAAYVGWVLQNARLHAHDLGMRSASSLARGTDGYPPVHRAQVGRWENGASTVSYDLVRRYETMLDLPEGQLLCAIDYLARDEQPVRPAPALPRPLKPDAAVEATDLLERALAEDQMSGHDWDRLSAVVGTLPNIVLRHRDWEAVLRRCTLEIGVNVDLEFGLRDEAAARLAGHPRSGPVVADMARQILDDPVAQIYSDTVALLQYCPDPLSWQVLVRHLAAPTNDGSLWACLYTLTTLVRGGHLPEQSRTVAGTHALDVLRDTACPFRVHRAAANLLRALDVPTRTRIATGLRADARRHVASILIEGSALPDGDLQKVSRRIGERLHTSLGPTSSRSPVLRELIQTAIGNTHDEDRSNALAILMLSPQGAPIGSAYADELRQARSVGHTVGVHESLSVLTWLLQPDDVDTLAELMCEPGTDAVTSMEAAIAIGNRRPTDEQSAQKLADRVLGSAESHLDQVPRGGEGVAEADRCLARGHAYVLGMHGRLEQLHALKARLDAGARGRRAWSDAVGWWLNLPPWALLSLDHRLPSAPVGATDAPVERGVLGVR